MTGTVENTRGGTWDRTDSRQLAWVAGLALAVAFLAFAAPGSAAAQSDQPGKPVSIYGEAEDELGNAPAPGTTIYAIVDGEIRSSITVGQNGQFGGPNAFDGHLAVDGGADSEVMFAIDGLDGAVAAETVSLANADSVVEVSLTFPGGSFLEIDVNGNAALAADTSGDGLLNDVDGVQGFSIFDVQTFFNFFESDQVRQNVPAFDFETDGSINIFDVQALFNQLSSE